MKKILLLVLLLSLPVFAQERATLTAPKVATTTTYRISSLNLDWDNAVVSVVLTSTTVESDVVRCVTSGPTATTMMTALNKVNLSVRSLSQRILDRVIADGCIAATVTGSVP